MVSVYLDRLLEVSDIKETWFEWDGVQVTATDVKRYLKTGKQGINEPYGDNFLHRAESRDKRYHIKRVAWFVQHPAEICGIEVDNDRYYNCIYPTTVISDGWHRLFAAYLLGLQTVKIYYAGRDDILRYLKGLRKTRPWNVAYV